MTRVVRKEWFRDWFSSPFYHRLYFERDEREAEEFIHKLVHFLQASPGSRIVDIACGRGRHSCILAKMGFDVTGFDLSFESIDYANQFRSDNLNFYQHDMRYPFWVNYFDYAFNFFTSFGYFRTRRENDDAIRTIAQAIKPKGIFVMDYLNVHYAEDHLVHKSEKEIDGVNFYMTKWFDETHFYKKIIIEDEQLKHPLEFTEKVAKFTLGDFNDMFSFYHLQIQEVFGDYQLGSYDVKKSPRLIMMAKKRS